MSDENPYAIDYTLTCEDCGREYEGQAVNHDRAYDSPGWVDPEPGSEACPGCLALGGAPERCLRADCDAGRLRWSAARGEERIAQCVECDAQYPVEVLRLHALGELVARIVRETKTGSAAEVGALILAQGRASLRRVS